MFSPKRFDRKSSVVRQLLRLLPLAPITLIPDQPTWLNDSFGLATPPITSDSAQLAFPRTRFTLEGVVESPIL